MTRLAPVASDALMDAAIPDAITLVTAVRDDPDEVRRILHLNTDCDFQQLYALVVALAAMVPDDVPVSELLGWTDWAATYSREDMTGDQCRRAHAAWGRGERDPWTVAGEREYQKRRKAASRAAA